MGAFPSRSQRNLRKKFEKLRMKTCSNPPPHHLHFSSDLKNHCIHIKSKWRHQVKNAWVNFFDKIKWKRWIFRSLCGRSGRGGGCIIFKAIWLTIWTMQWCHDVGVQPNLIKSETIKTYYYVFIWINQKINFNINFFFGALFPNLVVLKKF